MKRRRHHRSHAEQPSFQIAPFIDIVFVTMLFFLVKAFALPRERALSSRLPGDPALTHATPIQVEESVAVTSDGQILHNADAVQPRELAERMQRLRQECQATSSPLIVTVSTAPDTPYSAMVLAMNALHRAGVQHLSFATTED